MGSGLEIGIFISCPGDYNIKKSLRTTGLNHLLRLRLRLWRSDLENFEKGLKLASGLNGYNLCSQGMLVDYLHQRPLWCLKKYSFLGPTTDVLIHTLGVSSRVLHINKLSPGDFYTLKLQHFLNKGTSISMERGGLYGEQFLAGEGSLNLQQRKYLENQSHDNLDCQASTWSWGGDVQL